MNEWIEFWNNVDSNCDNEIIVKEFERVKGVGSDERDKFFINLLENKIKYSTSIEETLFCRSVLEWIKNQIKVYKKK